MTRIRLDLTWCCIFFVCVFLFLLTGTWSRAFERPEALEGKAVSDGYTPSSFKEVGRIERIVGDGRVVVLHRATGEAYSASVNDPLHENDAVFTLERMRCRLMMNDRNVITMAPESDLYIDEVILDDAKGEKRSLFEVTRGKAVFYAIRLFRFREMRLNLKTPTATVGVRGTKFGTEVAEEAALSESPPNLMTASTGPLYLAADNADKRVTRVFVAQGRVNVASSADGAARDLGENEFLEADSSGLGPTFHDPARVQSFMDGVEGPMVSGAVPKAPGAGAGFPGDSSKQQQDEMIRQLDQVEGAKEIETQTDFEEPSPSHPPSSPSPPPSGGGGSHHHP